jgi:hypothetical protein
MRNQSLTGCLPNGNSARSIFEIATGVQCKSKGRRTFQPVRRNSFNAGEREGRFWRPVDPKIKWANIRAAETYDRQNKEPGKRNGPLGHVALEIVREMYRIVDYKTGRLDPSIDFLMSKLQRSRAAICAALARLKEHGFIEWMRRTEPTGNEGWGPQVRQISNAYRLCVPKVAKKVVDFITSKKRPLPDDDAHRREQEVVEDTAMLESLPIEERMVAIVGQNELAETLARIGRLIDDNASSPSGQNPDINLYNERLRRAPL